VSNFEALIEKQNLNYDQILALQKTTRAKGVFAQDEKQKGRLSGCFVNLVHSEGVAQRAEWVSSLVGIHLKATLYRSDDVHTTIASHNVTVGHEVDPQLHLHKGAEIALLAQSVQVAKTRLRGEVIEIDFTRIVHTNQNVLAFGQPNEAFWKFALYVKAEAEKRGVCVDMPWGASMTLARFCESREDDAVRKVSALVDQALPLGKSHPTRVHVGHNTWWGNDTHKAQGGHFCTHDVVVLT
jgi:hypothetical protein